MKTKLGNDVLSNTDVSQSDFLYVLENYPALKRYCHYLTKSQWDGEDLAQETIAKVYKKYIKEGHSDNKVSLSLLYKVARNQWIDQLRSKKWESELDAEPSYNPFSHLPELYSLVEAMLTHLNPNQTVMFVLKEVFQYSLSDIAEMFVTSEGAVKASLFRTRNRLKTLDGKTNQIKEEHLELFEVLVKSIHDQKPEILVRFIPVLITRQPSAPMSVLQQKHSSSNPRMMLAA